ncbi:glycosyltransferase family 2 protein [Mariniflexile sp. HNIBRBA6329]|uniref:glycosyltransferase family 2 protein n=1 Tax=Mariniflexile sp. HNIBRBA6329 TaxID=3373088 RepID=UPI003746C60D
MVSVCVQTYQHVNYIKQCLDGILMQQTTFPFEVILGEDESNDGTREICIEYANKYPERIRLFLRSRKDVISINGNPTGRFNMIENLKSCQGKYIALCEGDDYWTDPLKLQKQVDLLEKNKDYSYCGHKSSTKSNIGINKISLEIKEFGFKELIFKNVLNTSTLIFRKKVIEPLPNFFRTISAGDWGLQLIAIKNSKAYVLPDYMSVYREHDKGIWSNLDSKTKCLNGVKTQEAFKLIYSDKESIDLINKAMESRKKAFGIVERSFLESIVVKIKSKLKYIYR